MQFFNYPGTESNSKSFHYSQAIKIGMMVKTSGQGGWDESGNITSDVEKQVAVAFENVEKALKEVNSRLSWENVYAVRSYHTNMEETFEMVTSNFKKYLPGHRPVWTCVEIGKLGIEGMSEGISKVQVSGDYVCGRLSRNRLRNKNATSRFRVLIPSNEAMYRVERFKDVFLDTNKGPSLGTEAMHRICGTFQRSTRYELLREFGEGYLLTMLNREGFWATPDSRLNPRDDVESGSNDDYTILGRIHRKVS